MRNLEKFNRKISELAGSKGSFVVDVSVCPRRCHVTTNPSYTLRITSRAKLGIPLQSPQFLGAHECLVATLRRPNNYKTLLDIGRALPHLEDFGYITWLGSVSQIKFAQKNSECTSLNIPARVWAPGSGPLAGAFKTKGVVHPVTAEPGGFIYYLLEVPAIQRDKILPCYLTVE